MHKKLNPPDVVKPFSNYAQGVESAPNLRWLHVSGQVGVKLDGTCPADFPGQFEIAMDNLLGVLKAAGMGPHDIVKMTTFITNIADLPSSRPIRDRKLEGVPVASTLLVVAGLARADWKVEIECTAAKA
jgi:enamine deaminase RidA (YjgF/YER057c/UK114 family)